MTAARDGLMPESLGRLNDHGVPGSALIVSSSPVSLLIVMNFRGGLVDAFQVIIQVGTIRRWFPMFSVHPACCSSSWIVALSFRRVRYCWRSSPSSPLFSRSGRFTVHAGNSVLGLSGAGGRYSHAYLAQMAQQAGHGKTECVISMCVSWN
ncbi:hypothetical protein ACFPL7_05405 [Dongia soli]|uniref:Uncharacterized protein n=1 Tax=Dongia soli TaxID=600628 RepID=A0ABU5EER4_9PROT|nr:hypothetical protein [Dongia soli]MDY0884836.1 hypothetical protein [Dongia soli]